MRIRTLFAETDKMKKFYMLKYGGGGHRAVGTCQVAYEDTDRVVGEIIAAVK